MDLPTITDDEGDGYIVTCKSKMASLFLVATNKKIMINPIRAVIGLHKVDLIIKDDNFFSLQRKYSF